MLEKTEKREKSEESHVGFPNFLRYAGLGYIELPRRFTFGVRTDPEPFLQVEPMPYQPLRLFPANKAFLLHTD